MHKDGTSAELPPGIFHQWTARFLAVFLYLLLFLFIWSRAMTEVLKCFQRGQLKGPSPNRSNRRRSMWFIRIHRDHSIDAFGMQRACWPKVDAHKNEKMLVTTQHGSTHKLRIKLSILNYNQPEFQCKVPSSRVHLCPVCSCCSPSLMLVLDRTAENSARSVL